MSRPRVLPVLRKVLFALAILAGGVIGGFGAWIFHFILDVNAKFITGHKWLTGFVGIAGLLFFSHLVHDTKVRNPRSYSLMVLGIACGIFIQAIFYFKPDCCADCQTDFLLKLAGCVILMVDGFSSYYRKPVAAAKEEKRTR